MFAAYYRASEGATVGNFVSGLTFLRKRKLAHLHKGGGAFYCGAKVTRSETRAAATDPVCRRCYVMSAIAAERF